MALTSRLASPFYRRGRAERGQERQTQRSRNASPGSSGLNPRLAKRRGFSPPPIITHEPGGPRMTATRERASTDLGRPYQGSQLALKDARAIGRGIAVEFSMEKSTAASNDGLLRQISNWITSDGIHFVLADLPAATPAARSKVARTVMHSAFGCPGSGGPDAGSARRVPRRKPKPCSAWLILSLSAARCGRVSREAGPGKARTWFRIAHAPPRLHYRRSANAA